MTIRSHLLLLLLPTFIFFLILISSFFYLNLPREIMLMGIFFTLLFIAGIVYLIADRISKPVRQLNKAALEIAAGDYETNIALKGPKEVVELAQTLNTMGECLVEHMSRLKESSLLRERMVGEYECALLLQDFMLNKVVDDFQHPPIKLGLISVPPASINKGLLLKIDNTPSKVSFNLFEASETGFEGLFHLIQSIASSKTFVGCHFSSDCKTLHWETNHLFPPLAWSIKRQQFMKEIPVPLEKGDMIFIYNSSFIDHFKTEDEIEAWFGKVLRHFSEDGIETVQTMLTNELTFLAKKQQSKFNYKIITLTL